MNAPRFSAIILAGGLSTRMKQFKPLLPLGKATVTDFAISTFLNAGADVFLVAGYRFEEIKSKIKKKGITIVFNPDYEKGMFSSIQAGVKQLKGDYQSFFLLPVDIPLVKPASIKALINTAAVHPDKIIYPAYHGKRGHPPLIPTTLIPEILGWQKEGGLQALLEMHEDMAFDVPVPDGNILFDIDTPDDYQKLLVKYQHY